LSEETVKEIPIETEEERDKRISSWRERKEISKGETFALEKPTIEEQR